MPSSNIAQMVSVHWIKGLPELQIRNVFKRYLLNHWSKFHMNVPHNALFHNCINGSAPPNKRPPELQIKNLLNDIWTTDPNANNFTELFLWIPSTKIAQMVMLCWTKGLPELQIRNTFKHYFLLKHWSKFKIISQDCSSWCLLPILHKWFQSTE